MANESMFKILVADDSPVLRQRLISLILTCMGNVSISEVADAPSTLATAKKVNPHVILLDLSMPGGGYRAIQPLKQLHPAPVVIVLTNYPYPQYRQRCLESGADYFLDKSSDFEHIPELLYKILNERGYPLITGQMIDA